MTKSSVLLAILMALVIWLLSRESDTLRTELQRAAERADRAERLASQHQADAERLAAALTSERSGQEQLRAALTSQQQQIEALKHESQELRAWTAEPLSAAARRLRERLVITGADAHLEHLSGSDALPATAEQPAH
ncbi:Rz-like lysis system protein LysB [Azotobacter armeniacus]